MKHGQWRKITATLLAVVLFFVNVVPLRAYAVCIDYAAPEVIPNSSEETAGDLDNTENASEIADSDAGYVPEVTAADDGAF